MSEDINDDVLVAYPFVNALGCKRIIGRMFCEFDEPNPFQACETFDHKNWEHTLFAADDHPIKNDMDLCRQVNKGLKANNLPRTDEGVVRLIAIWIFS